MQAPGETAWGSIQNFFSASYQNFDGLPGDKKAFYAVVSLIVGVAAAVFCGLLHPVLGVIGFCIAGFVTFGTLCYLAPDPKMGNTFF